MSERNKSYESAEKPKLFQVCLVPYRDGPKRVVIIEVLPNYPDMMGTSEILNEGTPNESLATPGSTPIETITLTSEIWDRSRVVGGFVASYGENYREHAERLLPEA